MQHACSLQNHVMSSSRSFDPNAPTRRHASSSTPSCGSASACTRIPSLSPHCKAKLGRLLASVA
jgi:hypothetical protein